MIVNAASFRAAFPEFANVAVYPDAQIVFWQGVAQTLLPGRWGPSGTVADAAPTLRDIGTCFFIAHNLVLEKQAQDAAARGGAPGINSGPMSSKGVGGVHAGYDTNAGLEMEAGHWNLTTYGTRFIRLAKSVGLAGMQFGGGSPFGCYPGPFGFVYDGPAWPGPPPWPGYFSS